MSIQRNRSDGRLIALLSLVLAIGLVWSLDHYGARPRAQGITIPNTFVNLTTADADQVNANFAALAANALNRNGGTLGGTLNLNGQALSGAASATGAWTFTTAPTFSTALGIASGGTNSTTAATNGGIGYGTGTAHAYTAAGTAGQLLVSGGAAPPVWGNGPSILIPSAVTVADVANTASITDTWSITLGTAMADGDEIIVECFVLLKNNKGTSGTALQTFVFGGVTQAYASGAATWGDSATEASYALTYRIWRSGADAYVALGSPATSSTDNFNTASPPPFQKVTAPSFAAGQVFKLRITLSAADANFYWKTKSAHARQYQG